LRVKVIYIYSDKWTKIRATTEIIFIIYTVKILQKVLEATFFDSRSMTL